MYQFHVYLLYGKQVHFINSIWYPSWELALGSVWEALHEVSSDTYWNQKEMPEAHFKSKNSQRTLSSLQRPMLLTCFWHSRFPFVIVGKVYLALHVRNGLLACFRHFQDNGCRWTLLLIYSKCIFCIVTPSDEFHAYIPCQTNVEKAESDDVHSTPSLAFSKTINCHKAVYRGSVYAEV